MSVLWDGLREAARLIVELDPRVLDAASKATIEECRQIADKLLEVKRVGLARAKPEARVAQHRQRKSFTEDMITACIETRTARGRDRLPVRHVEPT